MTHKPNDYDDLNDPTNQTRRPGLTVDYNLYAQYLEDSDLSEAEKQEFIETLWSIICQFVAMGFGVHPLQQAKDAAENSCGQDAEALAVPVAASADVVDSSYSQLIEKFVRRSEVEIAPGQEGVVHE